MVDILNPPDILLKSISINEQNNGPENERYFTHIDHLGSANWITESSGIPVQYIHYAPYGELMANQRIASDNERYKFTGKERDGETGYDYFGARYFWSALGHWLSVDPLAGDYPQISPYAYCGWNPVNRIDPDGRDDFEVNWNPKANKVIIKQIKNKNHDQFHIVDANGNRIASSKQYDYRTITKLRSGKWGESNLSLFDVKGDDNAEDLFKFLGSNFTTKKGSPLEWSRVMVGTSKSGRNIIGTSMEKYATGVGHYIMFYGYTIRGVDHNHPGGSGPSDQDIENAGLYHSKFPKANLRVFRNGEFESYDEYTPITSRELEEVVVIGTRK